MGHESGRIEREKLFGCKRSRGSPYQRIRVDQVPATNWREKFAHTQIELLLRGVVDIESFKADVGLVGGDPFRACRHEVFSFDFGKKGPAFIRLPGREKTYISKL